MKLTILLFLIFSIQAFASDYIEMSGKLSQSKKWVEYSSRDKLNIKFLLLYLAKSPTGKELIRKANLKARKMNKTLYDVIKPGTGSITDTTLIRKFSQVNPDTITYESRSMVYINNQLNQYDALLDLAHELTHFVHREAFNPYKKHFTLPSFISSTVEGKGGEVHAFMTECKVLYELFPKRLQSRYNCKKIIDPQTMKISKQLAIQKFYSIGPYYSKFKSKLDLHGISQNFPMISKGEVGFVSSAYGMPYPVAAYHEYNTVLSKVCENDKRRIDYLKAGEKGRTIASINKAKQDYLDRCSHVE